MEIVGNKSVLIAHILKYNNDIRRKLTFLKKIGEEKDIKFTGRITEVCTKSPVVSRKFYNVDWVVNLI